MLAHEIPGILPVNPQGGKIARAAAVSPLIEAGNVFLPHPDYAPWVNDFIEECVQFPNGAHDDQVDAMTQALLRWHMVPQQSSVYGRNGADQPDLEPFITAIRDAMSSEAGDQTQCSVCALHSHLNRFY